MFNTRAEAERAARGEYAVVQVDGGYKIAPYHMFFYLIREEARSLFDGGWKSCDKVELMESYGFDTEHAETICNEIAAIEEEVL